MPKNWDRELSTWSEGQIIISGTCSSIDVHLLCIQVLVAEREHAGPAEKIKIKLKSKVLIIYFKF